MSYINARFVLMLFTTTRRFQFHQTQAVLVRIVPHTASLIPLMLPRLNGSGPG